MKKKAPTNFFCKKGRRKRKLYCWREPNCIALNVRNKVLDDRCSEIVKKKVKKSKKELCDGSDEKMSERDEINGFGM